VALAKIMKTVKGWYFAGRSRSYQDHHGGGLWLHDGTGWFFVRNYVGIEWSAQFCADPKKIDLLRVNARRIYARFPESVREFKKLGIDLRKLLDTPIKSAVGIAEWTDSICNASVPLPQVLHTGTLPKGGGVHNYPTPVTDIDRFRRDDFQLWVKDDEGQVAAVVPVAQRGSGISTIRVVHTTPGTRLHRARERAERRGEWLEMDGEGRMGREAFGRQG
jgi:hypothetical protein